MIRKLTVLLALTLTTLAFAEDPKVEDFYKITTFEIPEGVSCESGGIEVLPDKSVAVCTRRGQIWVVKNATTHPEQKAEWQLFAEYLHEPLGLAWRDGWLYAVQRPEVTRMKDEDGDGRADIFETVSDEWGINRNYHEYNFGSHFNKNGDLFTTLCLTGSFTASSKYRGWVLKVSHDGEMTPFACGVRSPGGIGFNAQGDVFYTDNQGAWNGSSSLKWVKPGSFQGNPNGNIWYPEAAKVKGTPLAPEAPPHPDYSKADRSQNARTRIPTYQPPAVWLPHAKVGNSPTGIVPDLSNGKFGPFVGQTFVGEQTHSKVHRVFLEKINGSYQGACFEFIEGFKSGNIGMLLTKDGQLFTGGSNRGWGARGGSSNNFERVDWTGKVPFEIHEMRAKPDGFELTFTKPIDPETAKNFAMEAWTYEYKKDYGSPEVDQVKPTIEITNIATDNKSLHLKITPLTQGHVHMLTAESLRSTEGLPLLHNKAYYTLNEIPK